MSKLVDRERLAKLAKALDQRAKDFANGLDAQVRVDFKAQDDVLANRIQALEGLVVGGEGEGLEAVIGDVAQNKADIAALKAFKDEHDHAEMEGAIGDLEQAVADMDAAFKAADAQGLADAKAYADEKIAALVDSAPEAMDTLQELAKAIADNKDVYDAYIAEHAQAMAQMKEEIEAKVDEEAVRAKAVEEGFEARIAANEAFVQGHDHAAIEQRIEALEGMFDGEGEQSVEAQIAEALQAAKDFAQEEDAKVQDEVDALEVRIDAADQAIIDNKAACDKAMEDEVAARNQAIVDALASYADEEEVKAMLIDVISSLDLSIAEDQVVLKLGGQEGLVLSEHRLDLASDDDIDAIIAELDEE